MVTTSPCRKGRGRSAEGISIVNHRLTAHGIGHTGNNDFMPDATYFIL
jgi:hypothetical protein